MQMHEVDAFVARHGRPRVLSLSDDTHIFHFSEDQDWEECPLLLVNRNGHNFRLVKQADGDWLFVATWNGMVEHDAWMVQTNLRRKSARDLIALCGVGPQGRNSSAETLCLLPKAATTGRRKAVWRSSVIDVTFDRQANTFTLWGTSPATFPGKLWESREAAAWCAREFASVPLVKEIAAVREEQLAALEGNPMWGMF